MQSRYTAFLLTGMLMACLLMAIPAHAQLNRGNIVGQLSMEQYLSSKLVTFAVVSPRLRFMVADRISLDWSVGFGRGYMRIPGHMAMGWQSEELAAATTALALYAPYTIFVPNGASYYIPVKEKLWISPYVSLLSADRIRLERADQPDFAMAGVIGGRLEAIFDVALVSVWTEYRTTYGYRPGLLGIGISVGARIQG